MNFYSNRAKDMEGAHLTKETMQAAIDYFLDPKRDEEMRQSCLNRGNFVKLLTVALDRKLINEVQYTEFSMNYNLNGMCMLSTQNPMFKVLSDLERELFP